MLIFDIKAVGNNCYKARKARGLTQAEVAEMAELSERSYADIERGSVTMRIDSLMRICAALQITPNALLVTEEAYIATEKELIDSIKSLSGTEKETALRLVGVYLDFLKK